MSNIYPVILAGGSGTRLWPTSRKSYPKQFCELIGNNSLFQENVSRFININSLNAKKPTIVTNEDFRFIVTKQLSEIGASSESILIEPSPKNTAAAILSAALVLQKDDPDAVIFVAPSDHLITDKQYFWDLVDKSIPWAEEGRIVTFGIAPDKPETGYGYLERSKSLSDGVFEVKKFHEKPSLETATSFVASGKYFWNSGMFLFRASKIIEAFKFHEPILSSNVSLAVDNSSTDLNFMRLGKNEWNECASLSIDYAIMEKESGIIAVEYVSKWSDLGSWNSVKSYGSADDSDNVLHGDAHSINCENVYLRSDAAETLVVGLGLKNISVVATRDAVLVMDNESDQLVREVVGDLKLNSDYRCESFKIDHRPWGWYESLSVGDRFQVKRIVVEPGASLSLQSHHHRSEHWIIVSGTALVTVNEEQKLLSEGQSVYIPLGAIHRLENPGKLPMTLIEVQTGAYLEEDDIVRYEDKYSRS